MSPYREQNYFNISTYAWGLSAAIIFRNGFCFQAVFQPMDIMHINDLAATINSFPVLLLNKTTQLLQI